VIWTTIAYITDAAILATYAWLAVRGNVLPFHWANALGGPVLIAATILTVGWQPLLVLTLAFTVMGWYGLAQFLAQARSAADRRYDPYDDGGGY
jgi:hypothetical protein